MKKIFLLMVLFLFFGFPSVLASSCKYTGKIEQCNNALKSFLNNDKTFITPGSSIRSIQDFVCLQDSPEKRVLQIVLEENFKEIDDEMDSYLEQLTNDKNLYFGKEAIFSYYDGINHIWDKSEYFQKKYNESCSIIFKESSDCLKNEAYFLEEEQKGISVDSAIEYLGSNTNEGSGDCYNLAEVKIDIFNTVAYNTLLLNKQQVMKDQQKLYKNEVRTKYNKLLDLMMVNIGYIERIWQKWPSKIKNAY